MRKNLIGYRRVSTRGQAIDGYGLAAQQTDIKRRVKVDGHRIAGWESDEGLSGTLTEEERPGLFAALKAIRDKEADGLIVGEIGRLARELYIQEAVLAKVWEMGGTVFCADTGEVMQDDPDDPMRTAMRQMAGVFMQLERALVIKRLRNGRAEKARQGGYAGYGSPAFGLRSESKELVPDEAEQAAASRIVALRDEGRSLREIIAVLDAEGIRAKRGGGWSPSTVSRVLARMGQARRGRS